MTTYSAPQIAQIAAQAGFTGPGLQRAIACALAESGGNANATHTNGDGSIDRGLWQINSRWHPEVSAAEALNPATSAAAAYRISRGGTSWSAWSSWANGGMAAQMGRAALAAATVKPAGGANATPAGLPGLPDPGDLLDGAGKVIGGLTGDLLGGAGSVANATGLSGLAQLGEAVVKAAAWMANPHNWLRVLEVVAGAGVVILGIKLLADSGVGGPVGAAARGATRAGGKYVTHLKKGKGLAEAAATGGASAAAKSAKSTTAAAAKGAAA